MCPKGCVYGLENNTDTARIDKMLLTECQKVKALIHVVLESKLICTKLFSNTQRMIFDQSKDKHLKLLQIVMKIHIKLLESIGLVFKRCITQGAVATSTFEKTRGPHMTAQPHRKTFMT
jgi:invasion protein IalB